MIFGDCVYCGETTINSMPDETPALNKIKCEKCEESYWQFASRSEGCESYTEEAVWKEFDIDIEGHTFERKVKGINFDALCVVMKKGEMYKPGGGDE